MQPYYILYIRISTHSAISLLVQRLGMRGIGIKIICYIISIQRRSISGGAATGGDKNKINSFRRRCNNITV